MHELSIAQSILDIALTKAKSNGVTRITHIRVVVGALSTYVDESLRFHWRHIAEGTLAAGSSIEFAHVPGCLRCLDCQVQFETMEADRQCPRCGGLWSQVLSGQECYVDAIDVDCLEPDDKEIVCR